MLVQFISVQYFKGTYEWRAYFIQGTYPVQDRLLQCCAPRRSMLQHQEPAATAEQCSSDRSRGSKTIPRQSVAEHVTLAARPAEDGVQSGSVDVQSPHLIDAVVPPSPNPGPTVQPQPAVGHYDAVSIFHNDDFC